MIYQGSHVRKGGKIKVRVTLWTTNPRGIISVRAAIANL